MFWSTKNTTTYTYPSGNAAPNTTVISASGGGGSGSAGTYVVPMNGSGSSGQYLGTSGWTSVVSSGSNLSQGSITITGNVVLDNDVPIINTKKNKINLDQLVQNLQIVNEMFHIIVPNFDQLERHPTLMDAFREYDSAKHIEPRYNSDQYIAAYEQFKLLEALLTEEKNDNS